MSDAIAELSIHELTAELEEWQRVAAQCCGSTKHAGPRRRRTVAEHPLPWRCGRKVPRNIYDAQDEPIALLPDEATARLIVDAVNGRDMVTACHAALAELDETRWEPSGGMTEWSFSIQGKTFARVQAARELLLGVAKKGET